MQLDPLKAAELFRKAMAMRDRAYAPYSHFKVGAALLAEDGRIFTGCNVENASYGAGICAERVALTKAVSEGSRSFHALAVSGSKGVATPCGICRQVLNEFNPSLLIIWGETEESLRIQQLNILLPQAFGPHNLV